MTIYREIEAKINGYLGAASKGSGLTTGEVRRVSALVFKEIAGKDHDSIFEICDFLLSLRRWETGVIAYDWAYRVRKNYTPDTFPVFENWLKKYVRGWGDCDDFCTHAFGELLRQNTSLFSKVLGWTNHPDFWVRRAAAVILIIPIKNGKMSGMDPFMIADRLMHDEHDLVLKGYGWMLKVLSCYEPEKVVDYLMKHKETMPRVSFRYAAEKFDSIRKAELMGKSTVGLV